MNVLQQPTLAECRKLGYMPDLSSNEDESRKVVLVADDDDDIRALVAYRLTSTGYDVLSACNGEEALELAAERTPDLAILDVMMPRVDGLEVTRRFRADPKTAGVPVVLLTATVQEADVARGFESGADDYLCKPFSPRELGMRVRAILTRR
jgi:DNA-binding response OmpR family regulator